MAAPRARAGAATPSVVAVGAVLSAVGAISLIATIILQFAKVTVLGTSMNVSQANGICQSTLGQLGQAFSSGLGDSRPASLCHKAATIEDWKGITAWLAIVLILVGVGLMVWGAGLLSGRPGGQRPQVAAAAQMPAHPMPPGPMAAGPMPPDAMAPGPMAAGPMPPGPMAPGPMAPGPMAAGPMPPDTMALGPMPAGPPAAGPMDSAQMTAPQGQPDTPGMIG